MPLKSVSSYIRNKCSTAVRTSVVDKRTRLLLQVNKDEISSEAMVGLKHALFHTAIPDKIALIPVPTTPPSTPNFEMVLEPEDSRSGFPSSCRRPTSTQSLPPEIAAQPSLNQLLRSLPPSPSSPLSPSSSDDGDERATFDIGEESTLDRGVRSSSPCPYSSTESLAEEQNNLRSSLLLTQSYDSVMRTRAWTIMTERRISSPLPSARGPSSYDPEERKRRSEARRPSCTVCDAYVPFTIKDEIRTGDENVPIYHVLERPEMCDTCFKQDQRHSCKISVSSTSPYVQRKDSPPLPPLPTLPSSLTLTCSKDATYETVLQMGGGGTDKKDSPTSRKQSFSLNLKNKVSDSTLEYESISPFSPGGTNCTRQLKRRGTRHRDDSNCSHSYEPVKLDGYANQGCVEHKSGDCKGGSEVHDYTDIRNEVRVEEVDTPGFFPQCLLSRPAQVARKKLMKIDSHGYASVLSPSLAEENSCDLDYHDGYWGDNIDPPLPSSCRSRDIVSNVEEAWQHQQERGYAALTLRSRPPCPPPCRTSSDGMLNTSLSHLQPGATAQDYEVPIRCHTLQPPLAVTNRKNSIRRTRKRAVSSPTIDVGVLRCAERDHAQLSSMRESDDDRVKETREQAKDVHSIILSRHVDLPSRKHSASDVMGITTHSPRLPRISQ